MGGFWKRNKKIFLFFYKLKVPTETILLYLKYSLLYSLYINIVLKKTNKTDPKKKKKKN